MNSEFSYSLLKSEKLKEALKLIREVFLEYEAPEYSEEGLQEFIRFIEPASIEKMLAENMLTIWTCEDKGKIIGVLGARTDHINLLFVAADYHRRGIARELFNRMITHFVPEVVTVNSSPYAVEAYRRLGFSAISAGQVINGMKFVKMEWRAG